MLIKQQGPIPASAVSLTVAFQTFISCRLPDLSDVEREAEMALRTPHEVIVTRTEAGEKVEWRPRQASPNPALNRYDAALCEAEADFRKWVAGLPAYVLHPRTGECLAIDLNTSEWITRRNFLPGFQDDFLTPDDLFSQGSSAAQLDGVLQRVFFDRAEFESKLAELAGVSPAAAGETVQPGRPTIKRQRAGRKPKFDWDDAKAFARKEWDKRGGPFNNFDTGWKGNADLERLVAEYMLKHDPAGEPAHSTLGEYLKNWISEFEAGN